MRYQIPKGTFDILPHDPKEAWRETHLWHHVEAVMRETVALYGFQEIRTPLFEKTDLFSRSIGKETDIVSKEMYTFHDRAGRSMTLRPEGTAPVMRAFIEKHLDQTAPLHKLFYLMPMFRYERQQAGRYRQHHQFGVEAIGSDTPTQDVEVIDLLFRFLERLGLKGLTLQLNSIGTPDCRKAYRTELKRFLHPHLPNLSAESQDRYHVNPLRILDSKSPLDQKALKEAPSILDFLNPESKAHFDEVRALLDESSIPYVVNTRLVRGLDYYNRTVFEITAEELGAQNSLGGGGRYDGLLQELGGPPLPAFGFGAGLERIIQTLLAQGVALPEKPRPTLLLIPIGEAASRTCFFHLSQLRRRGLAVEMDFSGKKLKNALKYADNRHIPFVAIIGDAELEKGAFELKEMATGATESHTFESLPKRLA